MLWFNINNQEGTKTQGFSYSNEVKIPEFTFYFR